MLWAGILIGIIIGQPPILTPILFCVAFPLLWLGQFVEGIRARRGLK